MKRPKLFLKLPRTITRALLIGAVFTQLFVAVPAQNTSTSIAIKVTGPAGEALPGATVVITEAVSLTPRVMTTDANGEAVFTGIPPGNYNIKVELPGFAVRELLNVQVGVGSAKTVTVELLLVSVSAAIDVSGETQPNISALPNFNDDLTTILQTTVGAVPTGSSALGKIILDGKGKDSTTLRLDGLDATPQVDLPSADQWIDVVDSFQKPGVAYDTDNSPSPRSRAFAPLVGPGTGSVVEGLTLKATDTWRGQFYTEHLNDALNARNYFDYYGKNAVQRTKFGGKAGGPFATGVRMYFAYEGSRGRTEKNFFEAVPLEAICRCGVTGVLGSMLGNYLPSGTVVLPNVSQNPAFAVAQRRAKTLIDANSFDIRLDTDKLAPDSTLTLRYLPQSAEVVVPDGITGRQQRQRLFFNNFLASYSFPSGKWANVISGGFNQTRVRVNSENPIALSPELTRGLVTLSGTVNTPSLNGITSVPVATIGSLIKGTGRGYELDPVTTSLAYTGATQLTKKHKLIIGAEARFTRLTFDRLGGITYSFSNLTAFRASTPTTTNFLSDLSGASPFTDLTGKRHARQNTFLSYVQLVSDVTSEITLTYGLRYDFFSTVNERDDRVFLLNPETGGEVSPGSPFFKSSPSNLQPRFGLVYKPVVTGLFANTAIKLGVGIYSGSPKVGDLLIPIESDRLNTTINGGTFSDTIENVLQDFKSQPLTRQFQPLAFSRSFELPERLYKWEASFTRTLATIYDLVFLYTGNVGRKLPIARVGNQIVSVATNPDPTKPALVTRQFDIVSGSQILKPYGEIFYRSSDGRSNYNAFSVAFRRNTATTTDLPAFLNLANLSIQYTYALNRSNVSGAVVSNSGNLGADYGFNASDVRHNFNVSAVYNLWEVFENKRKQSSLLWGWRITSSLTARTGFPLVVRLDRPDVVYVDASGNFFASPAAGRSARINVPGGGASAGTQVPNIIPGVDPYLTTDRLSILNPAAFAIPQPGQFGNMQRGQLRGRGSISLDLGISRFLFDNDYVGAEMRMDVFNVFNRANFTNPTASLPNVLGTDGASNQIQPGVPFSRSSAGSFGIISAADLGRRIQFSIVFRIKNGFSK